MKVEYGNEKKERKFEKTVLGVDKVLLLIISLLLLLGTVMVFSASFPYAKSHYGDGYYYIKRQLIFLAIGITVMLFASKVNIHLIKKISPAFYLVCLLLLVIVLFGGFSEGVAKRWLGIPGTPLSFQPSELMKLGVILMLAWYIDKKTEKQKTIVNEIIVPGVILFGSCALVLLEKHLSGTVILA